MEVLDPGDLTAYLDQNAYKPAHDKSLYNYVVYDSSSVERPFAYDLDMAEEVKVFAKLPAKFTIDTPVGSYNPDWAYVTQDAYGGARVFFVVETKGGGNIDPATRPREYAEDPVRPQALRRARRRRDLFRAHRVRAERGVRAMRFLNNVGPERLGDALADTLDEGARLSVISSYFTVFAYGELKEALSEVDACRFVFSEPTFIRRMQDALEPMEFVLRRRDRERSVGGCGLELTLKNNLNQRALARECAKWVREKCEFRSAKRKGSD